MRSQFTAQLISAVLLVGCGNSADPGGNTLGQPVAAGSGATAPTGQTAAPTQTTTTPTNTAPGVQPAAANQPPAAMQPAAANQPPAAMQPAAANQPPAVMQPAATSGSPAIAMNECGLHTKWAGDEYCINPPPADKGFQMHIGPSNYDNPEAKYIMQPNTEVTETVAATSGNATDVYYYWRQYRMRPGSHHLIITSNGRRLGGTSNIAKDNPEAGIIAPENKGVGMPLAAHAPLSNSLHYFNFTDKPILKEAWVNFWYRDKSEVTEPTIEMFSMLGMGIAPGQHVVKHGACSITQTGRLLTAYGHVHAHNKRFSVWRTRAGSKTLVHEAYNWEHPNISEFSSTVMNPMLDPMKQVDGGFSGVVDLKAGDVIDFECDIVNDTTSTFLGANEAENDEMCILVGDTVGATVPPLCTATDLPGM
jgi:hypothetical protein